MGHDRQGGRVGIAEFVEEEEGEEDILVGVCGEGLGVDVGEVAMGAEVGFEEVLGKGCQLRWTYIYGLLVTAACAEVYCEYFSRILGSKVVYRSTTRICLLTMTRQNVKKPLQGRILNSRRFWPACRQYENLRGSTSTHHVRFSLTQGSLSPFRSTPVQ